jgi:hypothetical protein
VRRASFLATLLLACTGGSGPIDSDGGAPSSSSGSSGVTSGGTSGQILASEFDQSCTTHSDCVGVYEGAICNECGCANATIAKNAMGEYSQKRLNAGCPQTNVACANDCADLSVHCDGTGKCQKGDPPISDAGGD